ncbi:MAG: hypothetical protein A2W36_06910 [Chloroflexi bacterium RBG_16_58_14]|nr:MAG: hypothetical protein A2W36_06910 [Chloroflexi bacterium RBG_16_58_14]
MENMANVRAGADPIFPSLASFASGLRLEVIGRNSDNSWFLVKIAPQTTGWIVAEVVQLDQELTSLPEVAPPPTPIATSTPVAPPQVIVSPSSAVVRSYISITVRNFKPREVVTIQVLTESGGLIETLGVVANDEGTKSDGFWTPSNMRKGTYRVVARGDMGTVASATLTITK